MAVILGDLFSNAAADGILLRHLGFANVDALWFKELVEYWANGFDWRAPPKRILIKRSNLLFRSTTATSISHDALSPQSHPFAHDSDLCRRTVSVSRRHPPGCKDRVASSRSRAGGQHLQPAAK